jgi:hypothetical protein
VRRLDGRRVGKASRPWLLSPCMSIEEIVANIDARIAALQSDIQPLLDAKVALQNQDTAPKGSSRPGRETQRKRTATSAAKPAPAKTAPTPKRRRAVRRARVSPVSSDQLIALLEGSDGLASTALARETGGDGNQIRALLKQLADAGQVRKTGERAATRWHLITEEEQIATRAAEIEAQMKTAQTAAGAGDRTQPGRTARARARRS